MTHYLFCKRNNFTGTFHSSATKLMTTYTKVISEANHLVVSWTIPTDFPYYYKQTASCKLLCDEGTYYLTEAMVNGQECSNIIDALKPGSVCLIKQLAIYNPATIDPGIGLVARTLHSSKF